MSEFMFSPGLPILVGRGVSVYHAGANQAVTNGGTLALAWDSEVFDTDNFHDPSTNNSRITIPLGMAGLYHVISSVLWPTSASAFSVGVTVKKNGATDLKRSGIIPSPNSNIPSFVSGYMRLAAGDYIEAVAYNNTSGSLSVISSQIQGFFEAILVAP